MDNQGITAEQLRMREMQAAQQAFGFGSGGLFSDTLIPSSGGLAAQNIQRSFLGPFGGVVSQQIAQSSIRPELAWQSLAECLPSKPKKRVRDYSEHLTRKDEKILPLEKR